MTPDDSRGGGGGGGEGGMRISSAELVSGWIGMVIIPLDQNHSLCLRLLVLSVLIRPLSATLSLTAAFSSSACKSENNSASSCHPHTAVFSLPSFLFSTFYCVGLLR